LLRASVETLSRVSPGSRRRVRLILSLAWLGRVLGELGEFEEGRRHGEEALRLAVEDEPGESPIVAHGALGLVYLAQGDLEAAVPVLERALALVRAVDTYSWRDLIAGALGVAYGRIGRFADGLALLVRVGTRRPPCTSWVPSRRTSVLRTLRKPSGSWEEMQYLARLKLDCRVVAQHLEGGSAQRGNSHCTG